MIRRIVVSIIVLAVISCVSFYYFRDQEMEYVLKGNIKQFNDLMKCIKMTTTPKVEADIVEAWVYNSIWSQLDTTNRK